MIDKEKAEAIYAAGKEAVVEVLCRLSAWIDELEKQQQVLGEKIATLSKDSSTSHKAPSSDMVKKPSKTTDKTTSTKKKGGQPGHPKHDRQVFLPNEVDQSSKLWFD